MLLTSWEKHLSKRSLIVDDDVTSLFYCETFSSTGIENESEFLGAKMLTFLKEKTIKKVFKKGNVLTELLNYNHESILCH